MEKGVFCKPYLLYLFLKCVFLLAILSYKPDLWYSWDIVVTHAQWSFVALSLPTGLLVANVKSFFLALYPLEGESDLGCDLGGNKHPTTNKRSTSWLWIGTVLLWMKKAFVPISRLFHSFTRYTYLTLKTFVSIVITFVLFNLGMQPRRWLVSSDFHLEL